MRKRESTPELPRTVGAALRHRRKELGLTQSDVAKRAGITTEFYARLERGHSSPSLSTFVDTADALDLSADTLLGRDRSYRSPYRAAVRPNPDASPLLRRLISRASAASPAYQRVLLDMLGMLERCQRENDLSSQAPDHARTVNER